MPKTSLEELKSRINLHKSTLVRQYHIKELGIFGSHARGTAKKGSDVDILVEFSKTPGLEFVSLEVNPNLGRAYPRSKLRGITARQNQPVSTGLRSFPAS